MEFDEEDIIMPDEEVETPATTEEGETQAEATPSEADTKDKVAEEQEKKLLEYMNSKGIKYNGENVTVNSIDDLINTYQKGLNYDKVKAKAEAEDNEVTNYVKEKADALGITPSQYIQRVRDYEKQKEQEQMQRDIQNMVSNGVDAETARRVAEAEAARKEWEKEKAELQKIRAEEEQRKKENEEYENFIKAHPEVKPNEIPAEVFQEAKEIGLNGAYLKYENKLLNERIKQLELNNQNASSSPVRLTSDGSSVEQESKDAFLEGFDSVL